MPPDIQLTPAQRKKLIVAADQIQFFQRQIDRMKAAGIDVSQHEADLAAAEALRQGMLNHLGPTTSS